RKGGEATSENHDREFYEEIGEKGGKSRSKNNDDDK
ncbi:KGG domain-containing protein, partial [Metabacillus fastidiosus]